MWAGDSLDRLGEALHPDIVWTAIESAPDAGTRRGHEECRAYMQDWLDNFEFERGPIEGIGTSDSGSLVCSLCARATGLLSGVRTELWLGAVVDFADDGRIVRIHEYATSDEAAAAAGLSL